MENNEPDGKRTLAVRVEEDLFIKVDTFARLLGMTKDAFIKASLETSMKKDSEVVKRKLEDLKKLLG